MLQAGAEVLVQPTAAVAREVFWDLSDVLLAPCSLFDAGDTLLLHRSMMELANSNTEQAAAMQAAFFNSSKVRLEGGGHWQQEEGGRAASTFAAMRTPLVAQCMCHNIEATLQGGCGP